jgi:hypothetical protein
VTPAQKRQTLLPVQGEDHESTFDPDIRLAIPLYGSGRKSVLLGLLVVSLLLHTVAVGGMFLLYKDLEKEKLGQGFLDQLQALRLEQILQTTSVLLILTGIATFIVFLMWWYSSYCNLDLLQAPGEYSPGWAVGFFFVPFLNLYRPCQIAQEMWKSSDPETVGSASAWQASSGSALITFWWVMEIITRIADRVSAAMSREPAANFDQMLGQTGMGIVAILLSMLTQALLIKIILDLSRRQLERHARLARARGRDRG